VTPGAGIPAEFQFTLLANDIADKRVGSVRSDRDAGGGKRLWIDQALVWVRKKRGGIKDSKRGTTPLSISVER